MVALKDAIAVLDHAATPGSGEAWLRRLLGFARPHSAQDCGQESRFVGDRLTAGGVSPAPNRPARLVIRPAAGALAA
jgi:hypothetical protein